MSPLMDIDAKIYTLGTNVFEIQKKCVCFPFPFMIVLLYVFRTYADASKLLRSNQQGQQRVSRKHGDSRPQPVAGDEAAMNDDINITFNEATANAYQQWNVIKKNKFGIKQERIFGVDGKKVYNNKRGQLRGAAISGVHRAERNISSIVKIEKLPLDPKTFRITWMDNGDIYYIEYLCETSRECSEIVGKIKYLLHNRYRK
jgi:hypothetical protein